MEFLKNFFNNNSTTVGLCDLTRKISGETYAISEIETAKTYAQQSIRKPQIPASSIMETKFSNQYAQDILKKSQAVSQALSVEKSIDDIQAAKALEIANQRAQAFRTRSISQIQQGQTSPAKIQMANPFGRMAAR